MSVDRNIWITDKLINNNFDNKKVYKLYSEFIDETDSILKKESYKRKIRECALKVKTNLIAESKIDATLEQYKKDDLIKLLETKIQEVQRILNYADIQVLAQENKIPIKAFYSNIDNFDKILKDIYQLHSFKVNYEIKYKRLENKYRVLQQEKKNLLMKTATYEEVVDTLESIVKIYEPFNMPNYIPSKINFREAVVCISDTHFEENVSLEETHGINEYSPEIAKKRLDILFGKVIDWSRELKVDTLNIKLLGDMVSGIIVEEIVANANLDAVTAVIQLADYISMWIQKLSKEFKTIKILGLVGNHGRFSKKPNFKQKQVLNFDYILYEFIRRETKNIVSEFDVPKSFFKINSILDSVFLSLHGDIFRGGTGLNPVSGTIGRDIAKLNGLLHEHHLSFKYAEFGHFHHGESVITSFDGAIIMMNGSLMGGNEYGIGQVKRADRPSQNFYIVEKDKGVLFKNTIYFD